MKPSRLSASIRGGFCVLAGACGLAWCQDEDAAAPETPDTAPFVEVIRERWIVRIRGRVEDAEVRNAWARAVGDAGLGRLIDHVEVGTASGAAPRVGPWASWLPGALAGLTEGTLTWVPGRLSVQGRCRDDERAAEWMETARDALPEGWELTGELQAEGVGERPWLRVEWKPDHVSCQGVLPVAEWQAQRKRWLADAARTIPVREEVSPGSDSGEVWLGEVGAFLRWFEAEALEGRVEIGDGRVDLRGLVPDVVAKVRLGREARVVAGPEGTVWNFLEIAPPERQASQPLAAVAPVPSPPPVPVPMPSPKPAPTAPSPAPPPMPTPAVTPQPKPEAADGLLVEFGPSGGRITGQVHGDWIKEAMRAAGGSFRDETTPSASARRSEPWHPSLAACLKAVSEHLGQGELQIRSGKATLRGQAKSVESRERLLVAVARALPEGMRVEDGMTAPPVLLAAEGMAPAPDREPPAESEMPTAEAGFSRNIFFNTGSTYIKPEFRDDLRQAAEVLEAAGAEATLLIKGYADARGDQGTNEILSRQRAQAIRDLLVKQGVRPARLELVGVGAAEAGDGNGEYVWKQDRRVEVLLVR